MISPARASRFVLTQNPKAVNSIGGGTGGPAPAQNQGHRVVLLCLPRNYKRRSGRYCTVKLAVVMVAGLGCAAVVP